MENFEKSIGERIPSYALAVMDALERAGHRGYLVGGSLRDLLRGEVPHDFDMTTDALPEEMQQAFCDFRVIPTGLKHGTLTVLSEGQPIEVTTHRVDGTYLDSRRPESVSFTRTLAEDLSRRDFTVNAMAYHPATGLVDLFGGRADLQAGVIRAVGDPVTRFTEDALRILRAFRFSAQLDFEIEPETLRGAREQREGLARISPERIFSEISRLLASQNAPRGLAALFAAGCEKYVFFDTVVPLNRAKELSKLPSDAALRLAFLLRGRDGDEARALCRAWRSSNAFADRVCGLLHAAEAELPGTEYAARRFVCGAWHQWEDALLLREVEGEDVAEVRVLCRRVAKNGTAVELRRLAVNGRELQERAGVRPERTGALLLRLQDLVWQEPARNKKAILLELAAAIVADEEDFR
ncbi:MAG: polynucleotide adenylyltransferase [Clostridia bacterium]|nr:polynucleotide adenylyltransferase [Clostridia bacterium]